MRIRNWELNIGRIRFNFQCSILNSYPRGTHGSFACHVEGQSVRLVPLEPSHTDELLDWALEPSVWSHTSSGIRSRSDLVEYISTALEWQHANTALPFATIEKKSGRAVGSTRFANADHANKRLEIGWTWLGKPFQRTALNTEAKLLMLEYAFERLDCVRVELKTSPENLVSRAAILRLGAKEEGTLRHHLILPNGRPRDTVYYSILRSEWPAVRDNLRDKLAMYASRISP